MSWEWATGFYPAGESVTALFGGKGHILNDSNEKWNVRVTFTVNTEAYEKARGINDKWKEGTRYVLGFNDCTSFVGSVASSIGLSPPTRAFYPQPLDYVRAIIKDQMEKRAQEDEKKAKAAREKAARAQRRADAARKREQLAQLELARAILYHSIASAEALESDIEMYEGAVTRQEHARDQYLQDATKWDDKAKQIRLRWS